MRPVLFAAFALALVWNVSAPAPTRAMVWFFQEKNYQQQLYVQGTYTISKEFSRSDSCQSGRGLDWRVRINVNVSYYGGTPFYINWVSVRFMMGDATATPQHLYIHGNPDKDYLHEQSGIVWEDAAKTYWYNSQSPDSWDWKRMYVAGGDAAIEEYFYVGMPDPEVGCQQCLHYSIDT
jgi:hypothetical protein